MTDQQSNSRRIEPFMMIQRVGIIQPDQPEAPNFADYQRRTVDPVEPTEDQLQFRKHVLAGGYTSETIPVPELDPDDSETTENLEPPSGFLPEDVPEF
jgi:hypothetical protein